MIAVATHRAFWTTTAALVLVVVCCALLLTLAVLTMLGPRLRRPDLRARVGRFIAHPIASSPQSATEPMLAAPMHEWMDRIFARRRWWSTFKDKVEIARIEQSPSRIVLTTTITTLIVAAGFAVLTGAPVLAILMVAIGPMTMLAVVNQRLARQRRQFGEQLPAHLQELASAMRAGHSLVGGLRTITASATEPMRAELERVLADERLGVPLDTALQPMACRMACDDVQQVALVAALHERTGGNMAAVLDHVAEGARERMELRRELQSLTAQARLSRWVVTLLPPGLLLIISVENGSYMRPMFHTSTGMLLLIIAFGLVVTGSLVMKAIVKVEA